MWLTRLELEIFGLNLTTFNQKNENQIRKAPVFYSYKPELISRGAYHEHLLRMQLIKSDLRRLDFDILQHETEIDQQKLKPDFIDKARDLPIFWKFRQLYKAEVFREPLKWWYFFPAQKWTFWQK